MCPSPFICRGKPGGDRGGVVVLAGFVCIQTADNKEAGSEKSLALPVLPD